MYVYGNSHVLALYAIFFLCTVMFHNQGRQAARTVRGSTNCSGGRHSDLCFSTRLMWPSDRDGEVYAYIPEHQDSSLCHSSQNHCNPAYGNSLSRGSWRFKREQWQTLTQRLTLNTLGQLNSKVEMWVDGHHVLTVDKLNARNQGHGDLHIEGIFFSTFFGGSDHTWVAVTTHIGGHSRLLHVLQENFVIADGEVNVGDIIG